MEKIINAKESLESLAGSQIDIGVDNNNSQGGVNQPLAHTLNIPTHPNSLPKLKLPNLNLEKTSAKSRNIHNNIYLSNLVNSAKTNGPFSLSNPPSKVYYTSERAGEYDDRNKRKSLGSTIYRDLETLEHIIRDDKKCDVVPIDYAMKPMPKSFTSQIHNEEIDNIDKEGQTKFTNAFKVINIDEIIQEEERKKPDNFRNAAENHNIIADNEIYSNENINRSHIPIVQQELPTHQNVVKRKEGEDKIFGTGVR